MFNRENLIRMTEEAKKRIEGVEREELIEDLRAEFCEKMARGVQQIFTVEKLIRRAVRGGQNSVVFPGTETKENKLDLDSQVLVNCFKEKGLKIEITPIPGEYSNKIYISW